MLKTKPKREKFGFGEHDGGGWSWDSQQGGEALPVPVAKLALWLFLGAVAMMFAAFTSAYIVHMPMPDWRTFPKPTILWGNTAILLLSSATVQWAWSSIRKNNGERLRYGLLVTALLGASFVAGQLLAWRQLVAAGVYVQTNPASSFFYLLTGVHGLHLLGGIVALAWATVQAWRNAYTPKRHLGVELCAIYWHFLTLVWLWLFALISLR